MAQRKYIVGGNWKCNGTVSSTTELVEELNKEELPLDSVDVVVAPIALHIASVKRSLRDGIDVAAQNCYVRTGAFTGECSATQLSDFGLRWTILGHSERRHVFGESDELIGQKTAAALDAGLEVILCVGEKEEEREQGKTNEVLERQMSYFIANVSDWSKVVFAYEPVWAIGTGKVATPEIAQEVHQFLRKHLEEKVSAEVASATRIMYGGSVKSSNCADLIQQEDVDGFLVGGASLKADEFAKIVRACAK